MEDKFDFFSFLFFFLNTLLLLMILNCLFYSKNYLLFYFFSLGKHPEPVDAPLNLTVKNDKNNISLANFLNNQPISGLHHKDSAWRSYWYEKKKNK